MTAGPGPAHDPQSATTTIYKAIFPDTTNHYDTLFGGTAMQWMDEVAFIAATRFTRKRMVTVSADRVDFVRATPAGTIAELTARIRDVGRTSVTVEVELSVEQMLDVSRYRAATGVFTLVAVDEHRRPIPIGPPEPA